MTLICPQCKSKLFKKNHSCICSSCGSVYPIVKKIPSFLDKGDVFYEGRFTSSRRYYKNLFLKILFAVYCNISIATSRDRFIEKAFKKTLSLINKKLSDVRILDLGCGGGKPQLSKFGKVTGVDISFKSLMQAQGVYNAVVHADIYTLPFCNNYFDITFSSDVLGHIPPEQKNKALLEIFRVTKRGGFTIHSLECDSKSIFFNWAKKFPQLYQKYFIEMYGHVGLELYQNASQRFKNAGFIPVFEKPDPASGYLREISSYAVFFDNEFKTKSRVVKNLAEVSKFVSTSQVCKVITNFILGFFVPLAALFTPKGHRDSLKVIYQKPYKADDSQYPQM